MSVSSPSVLAHPALPLLLAAALALVVRGRARPCAVIAGSVVALGMVSTLTDGQATTSLLGATLVVLEADALSRLFGLIVALTCGLGTLYAFHVRSALSHAAAAAYAAASLVVVFAGDWLSLFLGWEAMALASSLLVLEGRTPAAHRAGFRYLCVHVTGGAILLWGLVTGPGNAGVGPLEPGPARWLMLLGLGLNAAIPPLHAWLTDAYPEASVTGSVFLSAFTTKTAVYVLIRVFPGEPWLVPLGVAMALYGVVYAVLENDIRRLLAYHIVSQVGYMVAGVGIGTPLALAGAAAHAFCHILYKGLLLMGAGAVIEATGARKLTELGGLARRMRAVFALYMVGAVSISGFPLFSGFVSKSLVVDAAARAGLPGVELLLLLASVGTFLHTGLKLPWFTFMGSDRGLVPKRLPRTMLAAMAVAAALCFGLGVFPGWLYTRLPGGVAYQPYTLDHVVSSLQLLLGTGAGFALLLGKLGGEATLSVDTDVVYRRGLVPATLRLVAALRGQGAALRGLSDAASRGLVRRLANPSAWFRSLRIIPGMPPSGAEEWAYDADRERSPIGATILWVIIGLGLFALALT